MRLFIEGMSLGRVSAVRGWPGCWVRGLYVENRDWGIAAGLVIVLCAWRGRGFAVHGVGRPAMAERKKRRVAGDILRMFVCQKKMRRCVRNAFRWVRAIV